MRPGSRPTIGRRRRWRICSEAAILFSRARDLRAAKRSRRVGGATMMKMTIEPVSAFSSLDVLVAMEEGLFRAEGLDVQMLSREARDLRSTTEGTLTSPVTNQGRLQERGEATMFQG